MTALDVNMWAAVLAMLAGALAGAAQGMMFHREDWLGGYASWPRRMLRLGHIAFFGIGLLNIAFAGAMRMLWSRPPVLSAYCLAAAALLMPAVCYLAAWRKPMRHLFALPVMCVLVGIAGLLIGRFQI